MLDVSSNLFGNSYSWNLSTRQNIQKILFSQLSDKVLHLNSFNFLFFEKLTI